MSESRHGVEAFDRYYRDLYAERWNSLRAALLREAQYEEYNECLVKPYYLDRASVAAAHALGVVPGERVLDLCAAPGGKTLVLACGLAGVGELVANERSSARRARLHRVIDNHLPESLRSCVRVTGHDAARWALYEPESYDRVLADVPCSSERHVIQSAGELAKWSPSRTRRLAQGAYAIGCAAVDTARRGGRVVYATCALSPLENDDVVERLLKRGGHSLAPKELSGDLPWERTNLGYALLPDKGGAGPMYLAILDKS